MSLGSKKSSGGDQLPSQVWGGQSPFLEGLYQQGADLLGGFQPNQQMAQSSMQAWQNQIQPQGNPHLGAMTQQFQNQLGYANQQSGGDAALTGGYGGGRQGVAEHLNAQQFQGNVGNFLGGQYQQDQNRAQGALGMGNQVMGLQGYGQQQGALMDMGSLLGAPTVLGQGATGSKSSGFNVGLK